MAEPVLQVGALEVEVELLVILRAVVEGFPVAAQEAEGWPPKLVVLGLQQIQLVF